MSDLKLGPEWTMTPYELAQSQLSAALARNKELETWIGELKTHLYVNDYGDWALGTIADPVINILLKLVEGNSPVKLDIHILL